MSEAKQYRDTLKYFPLDQLKDKHAYALYSRRLKFGVYDASRKAFVGIRYKFGSCYLDSEYHWDLYSDNFPHATAKPIRLLPFEEFKEVSPDSHTLWKTLKTIEQDHFLIHMVIWASQPDLEFACALKFAQPAWETKDNLNGARTDAHDVFLADNNQHYVFTANNGLVSCTECQDKWDEIRRKNERERQGRAREKR